MCIVYYICITNHSVDMCAAKCYETVVSFNF